MKIMFRQSWRINDEKGYKSWYGFVVVTEDEVITFALRNKNAEPFLGADTGPMDPMRAAPLVTMIQEEQTKKTRRFKRADVISVAVVPTAKRLAIETTDGQQFIKNFSFPDEVERVGRKLSAALFGDVDGNDTVLAATGGATRGPATAAAIGGMALGIGVIVMALVADEDYDGTRQAFNDLFVSVATPIWVLIGVGCMLGGAFLSWSKIRSGYRSTQWKRLAADQI